jgi:hypothetical protein
MENSNFFLNSQILNYSYSEENNICVLRVNVTPQASATVEMQASIQKAKWKDYLKCGLNKSYISLKGNLKVDENQKYILEAQSVDNFEASLFSYLGGDAIFKGYATILEKVNIEPSLEIPGQIVLLETEDNVKFEVLALRKKAEFFNPFEIGEKVFVTAHLMPGGNKLRQLPYFAVRTVSL